MSEPGLWTRRGALVSGPPSGHRWWASHAQTPTPLIFGPRHWRIYFSARDAYNRARIIYVDVDPLDDMRVSHLHDEPLLPLGLPGRFDSAGQGASHVLREGDNVLLYYAGMHLRADVPYGICVGLAESADGGNSFYPIADGPILSTGPLDPYFASLIHVTTRGDGSKVAWFMTGTGWEARPNGVHDPIYGLRRAVSPDGRHWTPTAVTIGVDEGIFDGPVGLARPWVGSLGGADRLWFCHRSRRDFRTDTSAAYRIMEIDLDSLGMPGRIPRAIGYANEPDPSDWDGLMQAYPSVLPLEEGHVMFYSGNGFGASGFGWATLGI